MPEIPISFPIVLYNCNKLRFYNCVSKSKSYISKQGWHSLIKELQQWFSIHRYQFHFLLLNCGVISHKTIVYLVLDGIGTFIASNVITNNNKGYSHVITVQRGLTRGGKDCLKLRNKRRISWLVWFVVDDRVTLAFFEGICDSVPRDTYWLIV